MEKELVRQELCYALVWEKENENKPEGSQMAKRRRGKKVQDRRCRVVTDRDARGYACGRK